MNILFLLIIHSAWSLDACIRSRANCEAESVCNRKLQDYLSKCLIAPRCDENCSRIAIYIRNYFGENCICLDGLNIDCVQLQASLNDAHCKTTEAIVLHRRIKRFASASKVFNVEVIDGVSGGMQPIVSPDTQSQSSDSGDMLRRSTRSPMSEQIRLWKNQLSGETEYADEDFYAAHPTNRSPEIMSGQFPQSQLSPPVLELQSLRLLDNFVCNRALYEVCLKHVSCRQLWNIFRTSCAVDASNQCVMINKEDCWQSFEGISWTGLGNCTCHDKNSDCHWIRLQTRYNKCIYEISLSGDFPTSMSFLSREWSLPETQEIPERYQISSDHYRPPSAQQLDLVGNLERPTAASGPSRSLPESADNKKLNMGRPASVSLLSKDSRPLQHQVPPDRYPLTPTYHSESAKHSESTSVQKEKTLQRVRPQLLPPSPTGRLQHTAAEHGSQTLLAGRNRTGSDTLNHRKHIPGLSSSNEAAKLHQKNSTTAPQAVHFVASPQPVSFKSDSWNVHRGPTREPYQGFSHSLAKTDMERTDVIYSTQMVTPTTANYPAVTSADKGTSSSRLTHSRTAVSQNGRKNSHRTQQITSASARAKGGAERTNGSFAVTRSTPVWRKSTGYSKITTSLPNVTESTSTSSATRNGDPIVTEMVTLQGSITRAHLRTSDTRRDKSTQRYSIKNDFTTERPVTSIPQPPIDKDMNWNAIHGGVQNVSSEQYAPVHHGNVSELKGSPSIINSEEQFRQKNSSGSTCVAAHHRCERFDACKWHLSEVQIRCTGHCNRQQCAAAIQRFTRYVARPSVESLMFCHCDLTDKECLEHQQVMYPRCLYSDREMGPLTCTEAVEKCRSDNQCQRFSSSFFQYCPVQNGQCAISELDHCRQALIAIRGSYLEYPCYCPQNDPVCRKYQAGMLPNNPCVEHSMIEYSRLMSDILPDIIDERHTQIDRYEENDHEKSDVVDESSDQKAPITTQTSDHSGWPDGSSVARLEVPVDRNNQRSKQPSVVNGNADQMPNSVSRINPHEKHYYESDISTSSPLVDDTRISPTDYVGAPLQKGIQPSSSKSTTDSRRTGPHRQTTSKERMKTGGERKSAKSKQMNVVSSPRIVGKTYLSPHENLPKPDDLAQDASASTSEPFVLLTQKHRNLTMAKNVSSAKSSAKTHKDTTRITLRPSTSDPYVTHAPPPLGGCKTKDANGNTITHYKGSVVRRYHDWAGRCSSWCDCNDDERLSCSKLPCLPDAECTAPLTKIQYGERLYIKERGACTCQSGVFICDQPEELPELGPGIYLLVGYSLDEVAMLKETVPKHALERSGFVSEDNFVAHDIGSRLQIALERLMPHEVQCRIMFLDEFKSEGNIIFQMEWFGVNRRLNETSKRWHTGQAEKVCSPYVKKLADGISRNQAVRFQLVLSTVKQIRVLDLLDGLPDSAIRPSGLISIQLPLLLFVLGVLRLLLN